MEKISKLKKWVDEVLFDKIWKLFRSKFTGRVIVYFSFHLGGIRSIEIEKERKEGLTTITEKEKIISFS